MNPPAEIGMQMGKLRRLGTRRDHLRFSLGEGDLHQVVTFRGPSRIS
jgi:hypothetical protein